LEHLKIEDVNTIHISDLEMLHTATPQSKELDLDRIFIQDEDVLLRVMTDISVGAEQLESFSLEFVVDTDLIEIFEELDDRSLNTIVWSSIQ
jgi:hypothetical protein